MFVCKSTKTAVLNSADLGGTIECPECGKLMDIEIKSSQKQLAAATSLHYAMTQLIPSGYAVFYGPWKANSRLSAGWACSGLMAENLKPGTRKKLFRVLMFAVLYLKTRKTWKRFSHFH